MKKHLKSGWFGAGSPNHSGRLRRGSEVSELLHAPRTAAAGSAGARKCPRNLGGARISLAYLPSARGHCLQDLSGTDRLLQLPPLGGGSAGVRDQCRGGPFARERQLQRKSKLYDGRPDVDYVLSGRLEELDEIDYEGGVKVQVAISAQMVSVATGATVWTNSVSEVGTVSQRDVPAVVSAMNATMGRAIEKLLTPAPAPVPVKTN